MPQPLLLLELPTDVIRLILSSYISRSPLSHITARFVCRRFRDLLPVLSQARYFCAYAAYEGYLDLIKWARANGCPWTELTCSEAAQGGHLDVLQWARSNGCPWNESTCMWAARNSHGGDPQNPGTGTRCRQCLPIWYTLAPGRVPLKATPTEKVTQAEQSVSLRKRWTT